MALRRHLSPLPRRAAGAGDLGARPGPAAIRRRRRPSRRRRSCPPETSASLSPSTFPGHPSCVSGWSPARQATFEIAIVERGARRILCRRTLSEAADIAQPLPATSGVLELANEGELLWSDPRVVQEADVAPALLGLLALLALTGVRPAGRKARSPRAPAGGLGPHRPAGRSHRRRHCRPLPRPPGGRPPGDRGPPAHLDHGPAPEPGRGEHGSPLAGLGELRPPPGSARQHLLRVAARRHRPHGVPPARPRSPSLPTASLSSPMPTASATPNRSRRPPWWRPWEIPSPTA